MAGSQEGSSDFDPPQRCFRRSPDSDDNASLVGDFAVLPQEYRLPGAQTQLAGHDGNLDKISK